TGRAVYNLEDQLWACDHHVVSELPIGYQGNTTFRNFRNQHGGLIAQHAEDGWPAPNTTPIGGTVGEMIIQLFSAPVADGHYKQPDGPLILRKGDALATHCIHNNGVIQTEQAPEPLRTSIRDGIVGDEVLFGEQKDDLGIKQLIYRVRYGCEEIPGVPPGSIGSPAQVCPPNPATDPSGCTLGQDPNCHPVDGGYPHPAICTTGTGNCVPANIVFANVAEAEMCIGVVMY